MSSATFRRTLSAWVQRARGVETAEARRARLVAGGWLEIGEHSYGSPHVIVHRGDQGRVIIGDFCSIAAEVEILLGGNHRVDWVSTYPFRARFDLPGAFSDGHPATKGDVRIGHDVWIGRRASILSGVNVGHGAVVAATSTVVKDVRPYAIVGGNPARELKRRFGDDEVEALLRIAWWSWPLERVLEEIPALNSGDVAEFIARFDPGHAT